MPSTLGVAVPNLTAFTRSVRSKGTSLESSTEHLISLLKRRQIRGSKACATATAFLLRRLVETAKVAGVAQLIEKVQRTGQRLIQAQPKEPAIGNIVRRVLGVIRLEAEGRQEGEATEYKDAASFQARPEIQPQPSDSTKISSSNTISSSLTNNAIESRIDRNDSESQRLPSVTPLGSDTVTTSLQTMTSTLDLLSRPIPGARSPDATFDTKSSKGQSLPSSQAEQHLPSAKDLTAEVIEGIQEILDEVKQADDQIAGYSLDHIHANEIILTHSSSITTQRFLLKASGKRKFTVFHAEAYPIDHEATHTAVVGRGKTDTSKDQGTEQFTKTLTAAGITVVVIPDSAVFALMSRVNKVVLSAHAVFGNGDFVTTAGAKAIAQAAHLQRTHVMVLNPVYQLSPIYPFDPDAFMEDGDASQVMPYTDGHFMENVDIQNPLLDYIPADLADLYITNL
ncbi:GCD complex subunit gcd7 [Lecanora helva]